MKYESVFYSKEAGVLQIKFLCPEKELKAEEIIDDLWELLSGKNEKYKNLDTITFKHGAFFIVSKYNCKTKEDVLALLKDKGI